MGSGQFQQSVSVVVPVYRSSGTLAELTTRLEKVLAGCARDYEILLVNDASPDSSWEKILELCRVSSRIRGINLMRNSGQHAALLAGTRAARHEIIVTVDDDLQHPPEEIPTLLARLLPGVDLVYGVPQKKRQDVWRTLGSFLVREAICRITRNRSLRQLSAFRAFRTSLRAAFAEERAGMVDMDVLLSWGTSRLDSVKVKHEPRKVGSSNYGFLKLMTYSLTLIAGHTTIPLRLASILGFLSTLFGLSVLVYIVGRYLLEGTSVAGFPFLASTIALFSGVQLFALGIFGEYLARLYTKALNRPNYIVSETAGTDAAQPPLALTSRKP